MHYLLVFTLAKTWWYVAGMNSAFALMLASAGVGAGHAVLPDHWLPPAALGRARSDSLGRVLRRSAAAAVAHVLLSLLLGAAVIVVGLRLRATVVRDEDVVVGGVLIATGLIFAVLECTGRGREHGHAHPHGHSRDQGPDSDVPGHAHGHDSDRHGHTHGHVSSRAHEHGHHHRHSGGGAPPDHSHTPPCPETSHAHPHRLRALLALAVPFGAAASPDLTILPVFLAAGALGAGTGLGSLLAFCVATVLTMVGLTAAAFLGAARLTAGWVQRRANLATALALLGVGGVVAFGLI